MNGEPDGGAAFPGAGCASDPGSGEPEAIGGFTPPTVTGRHVYLKPLAAEDYHSVRLMELTSDLRVRFRFRGATPGLPQWMQANETALVQFLVVRSSDHVPVGLTGIYNQSFHDQYAYFVAAKFGRGLRAPLMVMGSALLIDYTFKCWPFRKLYLELPEYNLPQFAHGHGRMFVQEARLREHMYFDGRWWDRLTYALYRRTWEERSARVLAAALPLVRRSATVGLSSA
jgi:RimJ/RimL family protein N-acetyltransferase